MRGFVLVACIGQLAAVQWGQPFSLVLFQIMVSCNPLATSAAAYVICKKKQLAMPWHALAFHVCCLTWGGIMLLPYTFAAMHIYTLVQALKRKQYKTLALVPLAFAAAFAVRGA
ncbi:MAG: hypothetical protein EBV03_11295 [Proteobacteria bacterium]|nr:hypothetical protein [Pseudomonadota bacterium]